MTDENIRVADALVNEVFDLLKNNFSGYIAFKTVGDLSQATGFTHWDLRELSKKLDLPKQKYKDYAEGLSKIEFLKGRIEALRANYKNSISHFDQALELCTSKEFQALVKYYAAQTHQFWGKKEKAIENFTAVKDLIGLDEDIGMESAKQIEKLKAG